LTPFEDWVMKTRFPSPRIQENPVSGRCAPLAVRNLNPRDSLQAFLLLLSWHAFRFRDSGHFSSVPVLFLSETARESGCRVPRTSDFCFWLVRGLDFFLVAGNRRPSVVGISVGCWETRADPELRAVILLLPPLPPEMPGCSTLSLICYQSGGERSWPRYPPPFCFCLLFS